MMALLENDEKIHGKLLKLLRVWLSKRGFMEYWR
jgi:hypothetical protein